MRLENLARPCRFLVLAFGFAYLRTEKLRRWGMDFFSNFAEVEVEVSFCRCLCLRSTFASLVSNSHII